MLEAAGWVVQDYRAVNLYAGPGVAVRELVTNAGPADYVLFVNAKPSGSSRPRSRARPCRAWNGRRHRALWVEPDRCRHGRSKRAWHDVQRMRLRWREPDGADFSSSTFAGCDFTGESLVKANRGDVPTWDEANPPEWPDGRQPF